MPTSSPRQRKTLGRVMHEFKHGELKSGPGGKAGKVKSRRQAIAIALKESGASKYESESENRRAMGGKDARKTTARGRKAARTRARNGSATKQQLYRRAKARSIPGRSKMTKRQLENVLH